MMSWFQTATGGWHWTSILGFIGWLVAGLVLAFTLHITSNDRVSAYQTTPRSLSADKRRAMIAQLSGLPKEPVRIYGRNDDSNSLAAQINEVLVQAGFTSSHYFLGDVSPIVPPPGLVIWVRSGQPMTVTCEAIRQQLRLFGAKRIDTPSSVPDFDGIIIAIGPRA